MTKTLISLLGSWSRDSPPAKKKAAKHLPYPVKLGVLAIMKNEAMNLDEWVGHARGWVPARSI